MRKGGYALSFLVLLVFTGLRDSHAEVSATREYQIKAELLRRFAFYITWPKSAFENDQAPFIIALVGTDPFGEALTEVLDRKVEGREIRVVRHESVEQLGVCHMVFINLPNRKLTDSVLLKLQQKPVLTVSDTEDFAQRGGMIALVKERNHVGLRINNAAARQAGLRIDSRLLTVAEVIKP